MIFPPSLFSVPLVKPSKTHSPKHNHANTPEKECQVHGCTPEILAFRRLGLEGPEFEDLVYGNKIMTKNK